MIAVIFEVEPAEGKAADYLDAAARLRPLLDGVDGFISVERFESLAGPGRYLSLSFWRNEEAVHRWRDTAEHRAAQSAARAGLLRDYRLRIAWVMRDYGLDNREKAPADSRRLHQQTSSKS